MATFDNLREAKPKKNFVVGINEDVTSSNLDYKPAFHTQREGTCEAMFCGIGSDGTVDETTNNFFQAYFGYDSRRPARSPSRISASARKRSPPTSDVGGKLEGAVRFLS